MISKAVTVCSFLLLMFCGTLLCAQSAGATPDELVFTNGDHLTGKLVRAVSGSVVFKSDMAGELTIPVAKIKELRSQSSFVVLRKNEPVVNNVAPRSGSLLLSDGSVQLSTPNGQTVTIPASEAAYVIDRSSYEKEISHHAGLLDGWNGTITGGATLVRSTTNGKTFDAGASLVRAIPTVPYLPPRNRTIINVAETYGSESTPEIPPTTTPAIVMTVKTNIFHAEAERDEYLRKKFFYLGTASFDHNYSQGLDLQQIYGAGIGYTAVSDARQQLDLHVDGHYERQKFFDPAQNMNLIGATFAESYRRTLPANIALTETANFIPAFNNTSAYAANASAGLALPVFKRLNANLGVTDNYLNDPAPFYQKNSFQFTTGISYSLK